MGDIRRYDPTVSDIILTSDSGAFLAEAQHGSKHFGWRFIFNSLDLSGSKNKGWRPKNNSFEEPTIKLLTSLHLQMRGKYFVLNGNSWWNSLIGALASSAGGCSFVSNPMILNLDKEKNKNYLLCGINNRENPECRRR